MIATAAALASLLLTTLGVPGTFATQRLAPSGDCADGHAAPSEVVEHKNAPARLAPAKGRFLVASRGLADPTFSEVVVLLLSYDHTGAMGIIVNRPTEIPLASALPDVEELHDRPDRVYFGGPVAGSLMLLLIRAATRPDASEAIFADVYASGSIRSLRKALGRSAKKNAVRAFAGHAGWGPGQLDREIARGDWLVTTADATTIFDAQPSAIWPKLIDHLSGQWAQRCLPPGVSRPLIRQACRAE